jgi:hypothetical protein
LILMLMVPMRSADKIPSVVEAVVNCPAIATGMLNVLLISIRSRLMIRVGMFEIPLVNARGRSRNFSLRLVVNPPYAALLFVVAEH